MEKKRPKIYLSVPLNPQEISDIRSVAGSLKPEDLELLVQAALKLKVVTAIAGSEGEEIVFRNKVTGVERPAPVRNKKGLN
jgi:hypothetical protein